MMYGWTPSPLPDAMSDAILTYFLYYNMPVAGVCVCVCMYVCENACSQVLCQGGLDLSDERWACVKSTKAGCCLKDLDSKLT